MTNRKNVYDPYSSSWENIFYENAREPIIQVVQWCIFISFTCLRKIY